ncbi:MAG TPA: GMC oxidoreductase [Thermoanaerobaculia bacterium]|nr:GMC oxidoreductase [Thermoanaerobaculia bacterium]
MGFDAGDGVLRLHGGRIRLYWDPTSSLPLYNELTACFKELSQQLAGDYKKPKHYNPIIGTGLVTAHPLGGAVMSDTAETGVVNPRGEVHGVPDLYVADGSIIPTALAINPSYTITALAERVAFLMLHGREMIA